LNHEGHEGLEEKEGAKKPSVRTLETTVLESFRDSRELFCATALLKQGSFSRQERRERKGVSSRVDRARDLRKISPFGRNDNPVTLASFARDNPVFGCGVAALGAS